MGKFSIDTFATEIKEVMSGSENKQLAAKAFLEKTLADNDSSEIIKTLNEAVPPGSGIGEMIVHTSPELTMLYARIPPRFQAGIHNHTIFACIGVLEGEEKNTFFEKTEDGKSLNVLRSFTAKQGEVTAMAADAIHCIENPNTETLHALHIYGGDFGAVMSERSLWSSVDFSEKEFNFELLLKESVIAMKKDNNDVGLQEVVKAIPITQSLVDSL